MAGTYLIVGEMRFRHDRRVKVIMYRYPVLEENPQLLVHLPKTEEMRYVKDEWCEAVQPDTEAGWVAGWLGRWLGLDIESNNE